MEEAKILIADASEEFIDALLSKLRKDFLVRTACNGQSALELLRAFRPDVLVTDLILPGLDGISLIQTAAQEGIRPAVLASTRFLSDYVTDRVSALGVSYLMVKPCAVDAVVSRIRDMASRMNQAAPPQAPDPRVTVSNVLLQLGFPTKRRGYGSLREAILLFAKDPSQSITKELYPAVVAQSSGTTVYQVEHAIRSIIRAAWERRDDRIWQLYFPPDENGTVPCPTNAAFISRIADPLSVHSRSEKPSLPLL